tara:strand:- start:87 stop:341 length:255 start_codon:yes stop_codon:yes gene_type:complete
MSLSPKIKIKRNKNKYNAKKLFNKNCLKYLSFINNLDNRVNSTNDNEKITIEMKRYIILFINIKTNNKNKNKPVLILLIISVFN